MSNDSESEKWGTDGWEDRDEPQVPGPEDAEDRLLELGLSVDLLHGAIREGQIAGDFCTEAHPVFYPGCRVYGETNGGLRLRLALQAWTFNNDANIPRAISPDGKMVITALQGDAQTGLRDGRDAQTRRPRKEGSIRIIKRNEQLVMVDLLPGDDPEVIGDQADAGEVGPTWFLLYFRSGDKVRCELSLATGVTSTGGLIKWRERLILPELDMHHGPNGPDALGDDSPVDVPVTPVANSGG